MAGEWHFSERLGRWVELVRSTDNTLGWQDVVTANLARGRVGYHVKMRKDPNNSKVQDRVAGEALASPREAAIRRAEWIAENPFPPKAAARKVRQPLCPFLSHSHVFRV